MDYDHVGLFATSSTYLRSQYSAQQIGKSIRLRVHVPGFDAICRIVQAGMGIGLIPDRAFEVLSQGMELSAIALNDDWADRELVTIGQLGGIVSPIMVGSVKDLTGSTTPALYVIAGFCLFCATLLLSALPRELRASDSQK